MAIENHGIPSRELKHAIICTRCFFECLWIACTKTFTMELMDVWVMRLWCEVEEFIFLSLESGIRCTSWLNSCLGLTHDCLNLSVQFKRQLPSFVLGAVQSLWELVVPNRTIDRKVTSVWTPAQPLSTQTKGMAGLRPNHDHSYWHSWTTC